LKDLEANRAIFRAAVELSRLNEAVDPVTIRSKAGEAASQEYMLEQRHNLSDMLGRILDPPLTRDKIHQLGTSVRIGSPAATLFCLFNF